MKKKKNQKDKKEIRKEIDSKCVKIFANNSRKKCSFVIKTTLFEIKINFLEINIIKYIV